MCRQSPDRIDIAIGHLQIDRRRDHPAIAKDLGISEASVRQCAAQDNCEWSPSEIPTST